VGPGSNAGGVASEAHVSVFAPGLGVEVAPAPMPGLGGGLQAHMPMPGLTEEVRLRSILDAIREPEFEWMEEDLATYLREEHRLGRRTIRQRVGDIRRMSRHAVVPVKAHGSRYDLVASFRAHARYLEDVEGMAATGLVNYFKAIKSLGVFRGIPDACWPRAPPIVPMARRELESPEAIHELLQTRWVPNAHKSYEQHLLGSLLAFNVGYGPRFPSEAWALRFSAFNAERHTLVLVEPKKGSPTRRIYIEPEWLCCSPTRASLANYAHKWRPKVDVGGTDAMFLMPTGEPFASPEAMSAWVNGRVKPKFPWYHGYLGRTWCANARLIDGAFDYARVADWLGHESVDMVRKHYERDARLNAKVHGVNWLERAFFGRSRNPKKGPKTPSSGAVPPVGNDAPAGEQPQQREGKHPKNSPKTGLRVRDLSHSHPLFSFPVGVAA
jgi:integrase